MSLYILPVYHSGAALTGFTVILSLIGASGSFVWALFGRLHFVKLFSKHTSWLNAIMALLLIYLRDCSIPLIVSLH